MATAPATELHIRLELHGGALEAFRARDLEVCLDGPAGTGKTFAALHKLHKTCWDYPGAMCFLTRKTNTALAGSALATFRKAVVHPSEGVQWFGGSRERPAGYMYPNGPNKAKPYEGGSFLAVFGMDKAGKVQSWEFDRGLVNEATECTLDDIEFLRSRMRNGVAPYPQLMMDCNPGPPHHWLNQRMLAGQTRRVLSRHEDNPRFYDRDKQQWTPEGERYIVEILGGLTGVRRLRLLGGKWAAAEGGIYSDYWDERRHLKSAAELGWTLDGYGRPLPPKDWPRYLVMDWGFTHPFVCQWWTEDGDGRLFMFREVYMSHTLYEQHAQTIKRVSGWKADKSGWDMVTKDGDPLPAAIVADPEDAEARATIERYLGLKTTGANKAVAVGIQHVQTRLQKRPDGTSGIVLLRDALVERDSRLAEKKLPTCTAEEVDGYVWRTDAAGARRGDEPKKDDDHGMDAMRYFVMYRDFGERMVTYGADIWSE